jgi:hypothetical protein
MSVYPSTSKKSYVGYGMYTKNTVVSMHNIGDVLRGEYLSYYHTETTAKASLLYGFIQRRGAYSNPIPAWDVLTSNDNHIWTTHLYSTWL